MMLIVSCAVFCDLKTRRIPNRLCSFGVLSGFLATFLGVGTVTPLQSLAGIVLPAIGLFPLYALRILGAGDIKLFSALGAFAGLGILKIVCLSFVFCAFAGVVAVAARVGRCVKSGKSPAAAFLSEKLTAICFSVPIALGLALYILEEVFSGGI